MDNQRLGATFRLLRKRRGWTQADLGRAGAMSRGAVSLLERGHLEVLTTGALRRVAAALDIRIDLVPRWRGGEVDRMLARRHSMLHEAFARHLRAQPGWTFRPEVSYAIYGERGVIDMLAWHAERAMILVVEFKTDLIDVNDLIGSMDRRRRLAIQIGRDLGWQAVASSTLVVLLGSRTNRRRVAEHRTILRAAFAADGRRLHSWLRDPREPVSVLAMWPDTNLGTTGQPRGPSPRVGAESAERFRAQPRTDSGSPGTGIGPGPLAIEPRGVLT